jgi:hypothetical protein
VGIFLKEVTHPRLVVGREVEVGEDFSNRRGVVVAEPLQDTSGKLVAVLRIRAGARW